jgi:hypothetical protein
MQKAMAGVMIANVSMILAVVAAMIAHYVILIINNKITYIDQLIGFGLLKKLGVSNLLV